MRKGRCLICLIAVFTIINLFGDMFEAKADNVDRETVPVYIHKGDTLWDIVEDNYDYEGDIRAAVREVKRINHMTGSKLTPGEMIYVPVR